MTLLSAAPPPVDETAAPSLSYNGSDIRLILGIALFFAVIFAAYWLLRRLSARGFGSSGNIRVLDRSAVGGGAYIMLVSVGPRVIAVGVNKDGVSRLCELSPDDLEEMPKLQTPARAASRTAAGDGTTFFRRFAHNMKLNAGLLPEGAQPMSPGTPSTNMGAPPVNTDAAGSPGAAEMTPAETAKSFADVMKRIQEASENPAEPPNPPAARESVSETGADLYTPPRQEPPPVTRGARAVVADYNSIIESLHNLGRIDEGRRIIKPVETRVPPPAAAVSARPAAESRQAHAAPRAPEPQPPSIYDGSRVRPGSFGPPEFIIPLKNIAPRTPEPDAVWTVNPEFGGEGEAAPRPPDIAEMADIRPIAPAAAASAYLSNAKPPPARRDTKNKPDAGAAKPDADKLDELSDRVQRRSRRYGK